MKITCYLLEQGENQACTGASRPGTGAHICESEHPVDGQANLPARWNTQAPHLTALEALEQCWSVFPLDQGEPTENRRGASRWHAQASVVACLSNAASEQSCFACMARSYTPRPELITGALSGVIVLDFDGNEGTKVLHQLGLAPHVRTGSGGYHVYFAHPGWPVKTLNGEIGQGTWPAVAGP